MPQPILDITKEFQRDPQLVRIEDKELSISSIEQSSYEVPKGKKTAALCMLLDFYVPKVSIVFCNTKKMVDELTEELEDRGYSVKGLHGDMRQAQRTDVMSRFKDGSFSVLVATDVAARGIDVNDVDIVFNFDLPCEDEYYIHRIGRTGRAGKTGRSFTLTCGMSQRYRLQEIAKFTDSKIVSKALPSAEDIKNKNTGDLIEKIKNYMESTDSSEYSEAIKELISEDNSIDTEKIACALFGMCIKQTYGNIKKYDVSVPKEHGYERGERTTGFRREKKPLHEAGKSGRVESFSADEMEEISISIGRKDNVTKGTILGFVAGESGLPGKIIGAINIQREYTTVEVPKKFTTQIIKSLNKAIIRGKRINVNSADDNA
jgi:ATP-dependent RNA helicase DeaD